MSVAISVKANAGAAPVMPELKHKQLMRGARMTAEPGLWREPS
jgi:hypothetical protein